ncbi:extracellular solute-binding protein [Siccirubricoccus sp. KC 17139]|uniref:Extracellular solute-binding protein n=1 Tax=Siccirubricoccus soli TaxID=2899147 RepID=A0ABT1DD21_9PROT|nr:extracellular solute-binding protein [Siccirubricoccus soli]MCO6419829.1 extracellular solute-binding protein [Siccirubricoccus soli]MCP2685964.1 extracellular solute-binding protein [Siccirubricoccus soli]
MRIGSLAAASALAAPAVHAQQRQFAGVTLRMNGYGGTYDRTLTDHVLKPLEERTGLKVIVTASNSAADVVRLISNSGRPHLDLLMTDSPLMPDLVRANVIEAFGTAEVPNTARLLPGLREFGEHGAPFSLATIIPVFNSDTVRTPLTRYSDIARPDLRGKVVTFGTNLGPALLALLALAEENGGSVTNIAPGLRVLSAARPNIVSLASSTVQELQLLRQGEAQAGLFWDGRALELRKSGTPIQTVVPETGVYSIATYMNVVRDGRNKEAALAVVSQLLSDEGMLGLPSTLRYAPTTDVALGEYAPEVLFNSPERVALKKPVDWVALMTQRSALIEEMNKVLQG